jgi:multidrug efflux pump subunit AcrA (membrane-fusion protein)
VHTHHETDQHANPDRTVLTDVQIRTAGIAWEAPQTARTAVVQTLSLNGEITLHPENTTAVTLPGEATLLRLLVRRNQQVEKGTPIAIIRKSELLDWQLAWLETQARIPFLQAEKDRYNALKAADAGALKFAQQAEANLSEALAQRDVAAARLRLFGINPHTIDPGALKAEATLLAPTRGIITHLEVAPGSTLSPSQPICTITNVNDRHADCWIFEKNLQTVKPGQSVAVQLGSEKPVTGTILHIDPAIDPDRRAARAHVAGNWPDHWVQGSAVTAQITHTNPGQSQAWLLNPESVIQDAGGAYVLRLLERQDGACVFDKVPVSVQKSADGRLIVSPAVPVQEPTQLVTKGAFYISAQGVEMGEH